MTEDGSLALHWNNESPSPKRKYNWPLGTKRGKNLLGFRLRPVVEKVLAFLGVIMGVVLEAHRTNGYCLDKGSIGQEIQDVPHQVRRPFFVARENLAAVAAVPGSFSHKRILEAKERDIGQVERCEIREDGIGQLQGLGTRETGVSMDNHFGGGGYDAWTGGWRWWADFWLALNRCEKSRRG
jgi:hypothetical protein